MILEGRRPLFLGKVRYGRKSRMMRKVRFLINVFMLSNSILIGMFFGCENGIINRIEQDIIGIPELRVLIRGIPLYNNIII